MSLAEGASDSEQHRTDEASSQGAKKKPDNKARGQVFSRTVSLFLLNWLGSSVSLDNPFDTLSDHHLFKILPQ